MNISRFCRLLGVFAVVTTSLLASNEVLAGQLFPPNPDNDGFLYWNKSQGQLDTKPMPSAPCTGSNVALQWNGSAFSCQTLSIAATTPTPTTPTPAPTPAPTPTPAAPQPQQPSYTYSWSTGSWGACTLGWMTLCNGTQSRTVSCMRNDGVTVANAYCSGSVPPTSKSCTVPVASTTYQRSVDYFYRYPDLMAAYYSALAGSSGCTDAQCCHLAALNDRVACRGWLHYDQWGSKNIPGGLRCY